ncbi:MAG: type II toxin-antitoxin system VapC family toxin [Verrucomicrobia bacterium]|nr:type II toxin-antitoxin system VapC family toxin [Verrucomicrobiota bacterium]
MSALFADSFYFLALLNPRDTAHAGALRFEASLPLVTTAWVLTEVGDALSAPENRGVFLHLLDLLRAAPDTRIIPPTGEMFERGVELYRQRPDKEWSLTDCLSFVVMEEQGIAQALTGDHHFEQAGFVALLK